ncbi:hypothetical protein AX16_003302 [Volvariella volvacea WC 439]|nr:hypothetical protein AX16_003302 [Volvariella volvacea WC 439]
MHAGFLDGIIAPDGPVSDHEQQQLNEGKSSARSNPQVVCPKLQMVDIMDPQLHDLMGSGVPSGGRPEGHFFSEIAEKLARRKEISGIPLEGFHVLGFQPMTELEREKLHDAVQNLHREE